MKGKVFISLISEAYLKEKSLFIYLWIEDFIGGEISKVRRLIKLQIIINFAGILTKLKFFCNVVCIMDKSKLKP
jgi:hypothetical protein